MSKPYPVLEVVPQLRQALADYPVVILQAPPGAGKSTVLPLELLHEEWLQGRKMIMLEPRRLAARSVAHRMASVAGEEIGESIGYQIRFESKISDQTRIEVVTEGILTRRVQTDNALEDIGLVIFDEFHERSLQADLALALTLQVQKILRNDLRILIMSATLDGEFLSTRLGNAPVISATGRQFPVEFRYYNFDPDAFIPVRMARAIRKALSECAGDVLAFLPGTGEINKTASLLEAEPVGAVVCPLYGDMPMKNQQEVILPFRDGRRKVVLSTSIAETSLTIEGITVVIDSGYARVPRFDPRSGLTRLETIRVTRDAADQRAGRAGRLGPGICYRLWNEGLTGSLVATRSPEILDADLATLILELSQWGVSDVNQLTWVTTPPAGAISQAKELLEQLDAIDDGKITERGRKMLQLPTHPRIAHLLLSAVGVEEISIATDIAALLEERDPLPKGAGADLTLRLAALRKWRSSERVDADRGVLERIERLASSWRKYFRIQVSNSVAADDTTGKLLASAYPERIAQQVDKNSERYKLANGRIMKLPPHDSMVHEKWISIAHLDAGGGEGKVFLAAPLAETDLLHLAHEKQNVVWDSERGLIAATLEKRIGNLVIQSRPLAPIPEARRLKVLLEAIRTEGLKILGWSDPEIAWQARVMSLRVWNPREPWPDVSEGNLLKTMENWLSPYLEGVYKRIDLRKLDLKAIVRGMLPWELLQKLDTLAPEKLPVPSGSRIVVNYFQDGAPPTMEVRLQELFGLPETPAVNGGKIRIVMHLLSPGYKPVQVTQDLKSFWHTTYHEVRKELRMRYPKHHWPEDPWTATAVRGPKRKTSI